jgi:hypothetical protein
MGGVRTSVGIAIKATLSINSLEENESGVKPPSTLKSRNQPD